MKKTFVGTLAAVITLSMGTASAFAADPGTEQNYVKSSGYGVCSNFSSICSYVDIDNDGVCDNYRTYHRSRITRTGHGRCFVDADIDNVCHNYTSGQTVGRGRGNGCHGRHCR